MRYRKLGPSKLEVSVLSFGAWQIGDQNYWGTDDDLDYSGTVNAAIDEGINFFDTAELYGNGESERVLGRALGSKRGDVIVATKVRPEYCKPDDLRKACELSLERLGTDYIDLYQMHWPPLDVAFEDVYATLEALRDEGKVREFGVSNFGSVDLDRWVAAGSCVSNQLNYSLLFRAIEREIVPVCIDENIGVLCYMPLLQGLLADKWRTVDEIPQARRRFRHFSGSREGCRHGEEGCEDLIFDALAKIRKVADEEGVAVADLAIAWVIAQPGVASAIVGARKKSQLMRNCRAANIELGQDVIEKLNNITAPLKQHMGTNADLWEGSEKSRIK